MAQISIDDKIVILLQLLDADTVEEVLSRVPANRAAEIRAQLNTANEAPISRSKRDAAIAEFDRFYRFVQKMGGPRLAIAAGTGGPDDESGSDWEPFEPGEDPLEDVSRLTVSQLSEVLAREHPRTAALVLSFLPGERAANVLEQLSLEHRTRVFVELSGDLEMPEEVKQQVVSAVIRQALTLEPNPSKQPDNMEKAVSVLRAVARPHRGPLLEAVESNNQETATLLFENLYQFEDILSLENRAIQRLLAEIDANTLATALTGADEKLVERVMSNLSKRASESLQEEIEFQQNTSQDVIQHKRKEVVSVLARLDQQDG